LCKLFKKRIEIENSATLNKNPSIKRIRSEKEEQVESVLSLWFIRKIIYSYNDPILRQAQDFEKKKRYRKLYCLEPQTNTEKPLSSFEMKEALYKY